MNIQHSRSYNLPEWRSVCDRPEHQPPARRGERRPNQEMMGRAARTRGVIGRSTTSRATGAKKGPGRSNKKCKVSHGDTAQGEDKDARLPTPDSPNDEANDDVKPASVSARRLNNRRANAGKVDHAAFEGFDYEDHAEYPRARCEEMEKNYWRSLTYAPPLYGADMPGSLFTEETNNWNLGNLPNVLDCMGDQKIPGVNTAYLYLGMWKATFAWHLEDVDLYSINYLHFGAPKQWYSISQADAPRFEQAMKNLFPEDAKACDQFLSHKTFLISPSGLEANYGVKVNKIVHHPGEFVITFPYGYHSGYNLGYNCAEAVNFGLESWFEYGKKAKRCDCAQAQDSVWIDTHEIERKHYGWPTPSPEPEEYDYFTEEEDDGEEDGIAALTPPDSSSDGKVKAGVKRKRPTAQDGKATVKRIRFRTKGPVKEPCVLCPNDRSDLELLPTSDGKKAHRLCAEYTIETTIEKDSKGTDVVVGVSDINKARLALKCNYCRSIKGACMQCSQKKCVRAYHATCAAAAGVFVEAGETCVFGEDGTEYKDDAIEFSCRFHRVKRDKKVDSMTLEDDSRIRNAAMAVEVGQTVQMQQYRGEIFAGTVLENRKTEEMLVLSIQPRGRYVFGWNCFKPCVLTFLVNLLKYPTSGFSYQIHWTTISRSLLPMQFQCQLPSRRSNRLLQASAWLMIFLGQMIYSLMGRRFGPSSTLLSQRIHIRPRLISARTTSFGTTWDNILLLPEHNTHMIQRSWCTTLRATFWTLFQRLLLHFQSHVNPWQPLIQHRGLIPRQAQNP